MRTLGIILIVSLLLISALFVRAQDAGYQFENVSARLGQLHTIIHEIYQDETGFLWFATQSGLHRYDGYELMSFRHDVYDTTSLANPVVWHVTSDVNGRIWASTPYGLSVMDPVSREFKKYLPFPDEISNKQVNFIRKVVLAGRDDIIVAGYNRLFRFNAASGKFITLKNTEGNDSKVTVRSTFRSEDGTIWLGVANGLVSYTPGDSTVRHHRIPQEQEDIYRAVVYAIHSAGAERLLLGTSKGLIRYDPATDSFKGGVGPANLRGKTIAALHQRRNLQYVASVVGTGIAIFSPGESDAVMVHSGQGSPYVLHDGDVTCILEDKFGNLWLGTRLGISRIRASGTSEQVIRMRDGENDLANHIRRMLVDRQDRIWAITDDGLFVRKPGESKSRKVVGPISEEGWRYGYWLDEGNNGNILTSTDRHGLLRVDPTTMRTSNIASCEAASNFHAYKSVYDPASNSYWLGTTLGLLQYSASDGSCEMYKPRSQLEDLPYDRLPIFDLGEKDVWMYYTGFNGVGKFNISEKKFEVFRPSAGEKYVLEGIVRDIAISGDGVIWLATINGLASYNPNSQKYALYGTRNGLFDSELNIVIVDKKDRIWVAGNNFIAEFNPSTKQFDTHTPEQNITRFLDKSKFIDDEGRIYFGTLNGVYSFLPDLVRGDAKPHQVVLSDVEVRDSSVYVPNYARGLRLSHRENDLVFRFSGLNFVDAGVNKYRCRLEGFDDDWRDLGFRREINYTNLAPGNYVLRANVANSAGIWAADELMMPVVITPPFTQTNLFKWVIGIVAIAVAVIIWRFIQYQQRLKREKAIAERSSEYRMQFLSNVSHEIRTPLNAVVGLSTLLNREPLEDKQKEYVSSIEQSSQKLLNIVNDLLDHSKLNSGMFTFTSSEFSVGDSIEQLRSVFNVLALEKGLKLSFSIDKNVPDRIRGDALRLDQILTNLLGNAIKYTDKGGVGVAVTVHERMNGDVKLMFNVTDTGVGVAKEQIAEIFERFATADQDVATESSGLGLYITKELVERQGGTIEFDSNAGVGTSVHVCLPFAVPKSQQEEKDVQQSQVDFGRPSILLVDDAEFNRFVIREMISSGIPGAEVTMAVDGNDALDKVKSDAFDLIIMDARMPGMDGKEATREIRKMNGGVADIPILGATAGAMPDQLQECLDSGMNDVIAKPMQLDDLISRIAHLLQLHK